MIGSLVVLFLLALEASASDPNDGSEPIIGIDLRGKVTDIDGKDDTDRDDQILQYVKIIELLILN